MTITTDSQTDSNLLNVRRHFSTEHVHPYDELDWERRDVIQTNRTTGETIFEQHGVEFPAEWSENASTIVTTKYFRGAVGTDAREWSLRQVIDRVADTYAQAAVQHGYMDAAHAAVFSDELKWLLVNQYFSFNSPVWFNVGTKAQQQVSACFILSVDDSMESILDWYKEEGLIFKGGSGAGLNLSKIRSSKELLSTGGTASGPVSFMRGADASAGTIKSGGANRRAAKMVVLDVDHPDIEEFIETKRREEKKINALREAGFDMELGGRDESSVQYQNANNSVSVTGEFMKAVENGGDFQLKARSTGEVIETVDARDLFGKISQAAWECADPGLHYNDTMNAWHTCPATDRITASNPCSEYVFLDNTSCFAPDTRISTPNGLRTIESMWLEQQKGFTQQVTTDIASEHDHRALTSNHNAAVVQVGERDVVTMTLSDGRSITVTPDHPFLTERGWVKVQDLDTATDRIVVRRGGNVLSHTSAPALRDRWEMLGRMAGDGVFSKDIAALIFGPNEQVLAKEMTEEFNRLLDDALGTDHRPVSLSTQENGVMQVSSKASSLIALLQDAYGMKQSTAVHKDVPTKIHEQSEDVKSAFLRGLFSADAWVGQDTRGAATAEPHVSLATSSPAMARSVQLLLSDMGIDSAISWTHPVGRKNAQAQLHIYNQQARHFLLNVGFPVNDEKYRWVEDAKSRPFEGRLKEQRPKKIVSIAPAGRCMVYDLFEQDTRSLIAEGMVAHNCNLASLNLMKFVTGAGAFDSEKFTAAVEHIITAMEISIAFGDFPTDAITQRSKDYRPLGIGYANLGALLMSKGLAYDGPEGRGLAAAITSLMTGVAYRRSAEIAGVVGPYAGYEPNEAGHILVMQKHHSAAAALASDNFDANVGYVDDVVALTRCEYESESQSIAAVARDEWQECLRTGIENGWRNAQASVLAPTGTIGFMMDCDTTGIEPDFSLVKFKKLADGGSMQIANNQVAPALSSLGYDGNTIEGIEEYIVEHGHVVDAPGLDPAHHPVFDCAAGTRRSIEAMGHVRMMAAVQPFLSGAISKTVNLPESATVEDIEQVYLESWKLGLKATAVYRDGCKSAQPLSDAKAKKAAQANAGPGPEVRIVEVPRRERLPRSRNASVTSFKVGDAHGYLTTGEYEDGRPGELFLKMSKQGSTLAGVMDAFSVAISVGLQYGVPLETYVAKFINQRFEPAGMTDDPDVRMGQSIIDYIFRRLALDYLTFEAREIYGVFSTAERKHAVGNGGVYEPVTSKETSSPSDPPATVASANARAVDDELKQAREDAGHDMAVLCTVCGSPTQPAGACRICPSCGTSTGCS